MSVERTIDCTMDIRLVSTACSVNSARRTAAGFPDHRGRPRWSIWSIGAKGMSHSTQRAAAATDSAGLYRIYDVPSDIPMVLRAVASGHVSGPVPVFLASRPLAAREMRVSLTDSAAAVRFAPSRASRRASSR